MKTLKTKKDFLFVDSMEKKEVFERLYGEMCIDKNANKLDIHEDAECYLILDDNGDSIGTVEFLKYNPKVYSNIEQYYEFSEDKKVKEMLKQDKVIYELGKISILKNEQRKGHLIKVLNCIIEHQKENQVNDYFCSINPELLLILSWQYRVKLEKLDEEKNDNGHRFVPVIVSEKVIEKFKIRNSEKNA